MAKKKHGATNDDFTLSVDLAPTILAAAGISAPKNMQGTDIAPLYLAANPKNAKNLTEMRQRFH